jgi:hypothetical protein
MKKEVGGREGSYMKVKWQQEESGEDLSNESPRYPYLEEGVTLKGRRNRGEGKWAKFSSIGGKCEGAWIY